MMFSGFVFIITCQVCSLPKNQKSKGVSLQVVITPSPYSPWVGCFVVHSRISPSALVRSGFPTNFSIPTGLTRAVPESSCLRTQPKYPDPGSFI